MDTKHAFKVGDNVRCIYALGPFVYGNLYTVSAADSTGYLILTHEHLDHWIPSYNFEPERMKTTYCIDGTSVCDGQCIDCPDTSQLSFGFIELGKIEIAPQELPEPDKINHPPHYTLGKIEVYDFIKAWELSFAEGNVVKYVVRAPHKGRPIEDLKKARWYLDQLIKDAEDAHG